ncbi:cytochrome c oxidase, subunit II [Parvularcula bermudensis HTCC2503]|uniref:Cytochrome c oxidase subunit 2 n=1 Tax=Parvularcula bermudensis (strain ATCC BAA-594 / HTCC2503 / KCTC 12087) TaxID=314260 RepID=E0TD52_PARBH|nr:cytochrome c oxidase subunit II [Parvularcula bermudensis]ADM08711.1 cytochrome c oxidase, subunit II [Parvularcula bermudensis HTCC2503]
MKLALPAFLSSLALAPMAVAAQSLGEPGFEDVPHNSVIALREAATPVAEEIHFFHDFVILPVMVGISLFVLALLIWVVLRYNAKANPVPNTFSHNTLVEVVWTVVPVLILVFIALFSFDLLYLQDRVPDAQVYEYDEGTQRARIPNAEVASRRVTQERHLEVALVDKRSRQKQLLSPEQYDVQGYGEEELVIALADPVPNGQLLRVTGGRSRAGRKPFLGLFGEDESQVIPAPSVTIKAIGFQWGWSYVYPDFGDFEFDALMAPKDSVPSNLYRLATTNDVVVPAGETIRIATVGRDVIHSWAMPAFGIKIDAIPGRYNETWFYTENEGTYYGQCSEMCGLDHAFMPISVRVVSRPEFEAWVNEQAELNGLDPFFDLPNEQLAAAPAPAAAN